jgi:hypothetical protein
MADGKGFAERLFSLAEHEVIAICAMMLVIVLTFRAAKSLKESPGDVGALAMLLPLVLFAPALARGTAAD